MSWRVVDVEFRFQLSYAAFNALLFASDGPKLCHRFSVIALEGIPQHFKLK